MKLLVNADDSLSTYLAMDNKNPYTTYGISEQVFKDQNSKEIREGRFCKRCGHKKKSSESNKRKPCVFSHTFHKYSY